MTYIETNKKRKIKVKKKKKRKIDDQGLVCFCRAILRKKYIYIKGAAALESMIIHNWKNGLTRVAQSKWPRMSWYAVAGSHQG